MTLLQEIQAACSADLIASKEHGAIAALVSVGRTRPVTTEIGNGTILETIGLTSGGALLDAIHATPSLKYVLPLLDQGRLKVGSALVQGAIDTFVSAAVITSGEGAALKALGKEPNPVSVQQVIEALGG